MSRYLARRIEQTEDVRVRHRTEAVRKSPAPKWVEALERSHEFARSHVPNRDNVMHAHALLTAESPTLAASQKGGCAPGAWADPDKGQTTDNQLAQLEE